MANKQACFLYTDDTLQFGSDEELYNAAIEVRKCRNDIVYFAEHYCNIIDEEGKHLIILRDFQKEFLRNQHKYNRYMLMCSRQVGKSTIAAIAITHFSLFNPYKFIALVSKDKSGAKEVLEKIRVIYSMLPKWLQRAVVSFGKEHVELAKEVRIKPFPAQSDEIRGFSIDYLYLDEFAFLHQNIADTFLTGVMPTIASRSNSKLLITTTPKGKNHFFKMWSNAKDELSEEDVANGIFKRAKVIWSDIPGRDTEWANRQKASLGNDELLFRQEYECEFLDQFRSSVYTMKHGLNYWDSDEITKLQVMDIDPDIFDTGGSVDPEFNLAYFYKNINLLDDEENVFIGGCDVANGSGLDYTVLNIFWLNKEERRLEQFFKYSSNELTAIEFAHAMDCILKIILKDTVQWLAIENNPGGGGNSLIETLLAIDSDHAEILYADKLSTKKELFGTRTNDSTKNDRVSRIRKLINKGKIVLHDPQTISEHIALIQDGTKVRSSNKETGKKNTQSHDDECSSLWQMAEFTDDERYEAYFTNRIIAKKEIVESVDNTSAQYVAGLRNNREYDSWILQQNVLFDENDEPIQDINYYKALIYSNSGRRNTRKIGLNNRW